MSIEEQVKEMIRDESAADVDAFISRFKEAPQCLKEQTKREFSYSERDDGSVAMLILEMSYDQSKTVKRKGKDAPKPRHLPKRMSSYEEFRGHTNVFRVSPSRWRYTGRSLSSIFKSASSKGHRNRRPFEILNCLLGSHAVFVRATLQQPQPRRSA